MALTRITKGVIKPNENYDTHNINSTGIVTAIGLDVNGSGDISGDLNVGGILTYEDVTSIDSVGIITAQKDIHVGAGVSAVGIGTFGGLDINGDLDVDGHTNLDNVSVAGVTTFTDDVYFDGATANRDIIFDRSANTLQVKPNAILKIGQGSYSTDLYTDGTNTIFNHNQNAGLFIKANIFQVYGNGTSGGNAYDGTTFRVMTGKVELGYEVPNGGATTLDNLVTTPIGVTVGTGVTIERNGQATFVGVVTATTFVGNGDFVELDVDGHTNLDNVSIAGVTTTTGNIHLNSTDKKIYLTSDYDQYITANAASNYMAFAAGNQERLRIASDGTLTYRTGSGKGYDFNSSGSSAGVANMFCPASYTIAFGTNNNERLRINSAGNLEQTLTVDAQGFKQLAGSNHYVYNIIDANRSAADDHILIQQGRWNGKNVAAMKFRAGSDTSNKDDGHITFETSSANNQTEKLRIKSDGNVGINTNNPQDFLHIQATSGQSTRFTGNQIKFNRASSFSYIDQYGAGDLAIRTTPSGSQLNRLVILSGGNIGIGEDAPSEKLQVKGDILLGTTGGDVALKFEYSNHQFAKIVGNGRDSSGYGDIDFYTSTGSGVSNLTQKMTIRADGKVGINEDSPDTLLHLKGNDTAYSGSVAVGAILTLQDTAGRVAQFIAPGSAGDAGVGTKTNHHFQIFAGNSPKVFVNVTDSSTSFYGDVNSVDTTSGSTVTRTLKVGASAASGTNNGTIIINNGGLGNASLQFDYESSAARAKIYTYRSTNDLIFDTSGVEKFRIFNSGDIAIPTVGAKIYTNNSGGNLTIQGGATYPGSAIKFNGGTNGGTGVMHFYSGNAASYEERMILTAGGSLSIGGNATGNRLTVVGPSASQGGANSGTITDSLAMFYGGKRTTSTHLAVDTPIIHIKGQITDTGTSSTGTHETGRIVFSGRRATGARNEIKSFTEWNYNNQTAGGAMTFSTAPVSSNGSSDTKEVLKLQSNGDARIYNGMSILKVDNDTSNFSKSGFVLSMPTYTEYHYVWGDNGTGGSGQAAYKITLTCGSYFHSEFIYTQHQTNGGHHMHTYARGKWANNHTTHTGFMYEFSGGGSGLTHTFTVSDQNDNGTVDLKAGLTAAGASGASYRGFYGGGNENTSSGTGSATGKFVIDETRTYNTASTSTRGLIIRVYFGSFSISKSTN